MEPVEVRDATADDVPALRDVFRRAAWSNEGDRPLLTSHPEFLEWSDLGVREGRTRAAVAGSRVIGFSSIVTAGDIVELEDLFVDPDWMRRGAARALVADVVDRARRSGAREVAVDANEHALGFYERVGFIASGPVGLEHGTAIRMTRPVATEPAGDGAHRADA